MIIVRLFKFEFFTVIKWPSNKKCSLGKSSSKVVFVSSLR